MSMDDLNTPPVMKDLIMRPRGLVLVTGQSAAILDNCATALMYASVSFSLGGAHLLIIPRIVYNLYSFWYLFSSTNIAQYPHAMLSNCLKYLSFDGRTSPCNLVLSFWISPGLLILNPLLIFFAFIDER